LKERPKTIIGLILLWISLCSLFLLWGAYTLTVLINMAVKWTYPVGSEGLAPILHFGFILTTIVWFLFSFVFISIAIGTLKAHDWVWTTGLILSTFFLAIFALMLGSFIIIFIIYSDFITFFVQYGLITTILAFITDLGIIFFLTRPATKFYFHMAKEQKKLH